MDKSGRENPEQQDTLENLDVSLMCCWGEKSHQKGNQGKVAFLIKRLLSLQLGPVVNSQAERK